MLECISAFDNYVRNLASTKAGMTLMGAVEETKSHKRNVTTLIVSFSSDLITLKQKHHQIFGLQNN